MATKNKNDFIEAIKALNKQKDISLDNLKQYLIEVFKKAFEKDDTFQRTEQNKTSLNYLPANVEVEIDFEKGIIKIQKEYEIVQEFTDETKRFTEILINDERIDQSKYSVGDKFIEKIDLSNLSIGKAQYIKQLLIQKTREAEKLKIFDKFHDLKEQIVPAKVYKVHSNYLILEYDGASIFVPKSEVPDINKFRIGEIIKVYIVDVTKSSRDAQIIGSRSNNNFVKKLIEQEIEDVEDQIVTIDKIVRVPGIKTKIIVSSKVAEVDPIGTIIGVRGKKIKPIIDELKGERIDVIRNSDNIKDILAQAILPSKLEGISIVEKEGRTSYILVVKKEDFLAALGKRGVNVKLVASLVEAKIEIKIVEDAKKENIKWEKYQSSLNNQKFNSTKKNVDYDLDYYDIEDFEDMEEDYIQ